MTAVSQVRKNLFETCCRLCLGTSNDRTLIDVFTVNNLSTIIRDMFNINITPIDKCTTRICTKCLADSYDFYRKNSKYLQEKSSVLKNFELLSRNSVNNLDTPSTSKTAGCVDSGTTVKDTSPNADHASNLQESAATSKRVAQYDKNEKSRNANVRTDQSNLSSKTKKPTSKLLVPGLKQKTTQSSNNPETTKRTPKMPSAPANQTALIVTAEHTDFGKKADNQANRKRKLTNGSDESESRTKVAKAQTNIVARSGSNTLLRELLCIAHDANASPNSNRGSNHKLNKDPKSAGKLKPLGNTATPDPKKVENNSKTMKNATSKTDFDKTKRIAQKNRKDTTNKEMNAGKSPGSSVSGGLADNNCQAKESSVPNKHRASSKVWQTKGKQDQSQNQLKTSTYRIPRVSIPLKRLTDVSKEPMAGSNHGSSNEKEQQSMTNSKTVGIATAQSMSSAQEENLDSNMNTLVDANTATQIPSSSDKSLPLSAEKPSVVNRQPSVDKGKTTSESNAIQSLDITRAQNEADQLGHPSNFSSVDKSSEPTVVETSNPATKSPKVGIKHRRHSTYGSIRVCTNLFDAPQKSVEFAAIRNNLMIRKPPPDESLTRSNGAANNRPDPSTIGQNHDDTVVSVSPMQIPAPNMSAVRPPPPRRKSVCFGINNQPILMLNNVSLSSDPTRLIAVQQLVNNTTANSVMPLQRVSVTRALPSGMNTVMPAPMLTVRGPAQRNVIGSPIAEANLARHSSHAQASSTAVPPLRTYGRPSRVVSSVTAGIATPSQLTVDTRTTLVRPPHHQGSAAGACTLREFRFISPSTGVTLPPPVARNIMASQLTPSAGADSIASVLRQEQTRQ